MEQHRLNVPLTVNELFKLSVPLGLLIVRLPNVSPPVRAKFCAPEPLNVMVVPPDENVPAFDQLPASEMFWTLASRVVPD